MTKRWIVKLERAEDRPDVDAFLDALDAVCRSHGMAISHEDQHGAFVIERYDAKLISWLRDAADNRGPIT